MRGCSVNNAISAAETAPTLSAEQRNRILGHLAAARTPHCDGRARPADCDTCPLCGRTGGLRQH